MYEQITLQDEISNAENSYELVQSLKKHKENGTQYVYSYGVAIPIGRLMQRIVILAKEKKYRLDEIHRQICYEFQP